jgi:hypothetical protein
MVSLVDLGRLRKTVKLRGQDIEVQGLPAHFIVDMLATSNELRLVMAERAVSGDIIMALAAQFPHMLAQCIAMGVGKQGDAETIQFALFDLMPGEWIELMEPIVELTFPRGVKSFVDGLTRLVRHVAPDAAGWAAATNSPAPSTRASAQDIPPTRHGDTPPDSSKGGSRSSDEMTSQPSAA